MQYLTEYKEEFMRKHQWIWILSFVLATGLIVPQVVFAAEKPLVIALKGDAARFDPHSRAEGNTTTIQRYIFDALVKYDENWKPVPALAERWKMLDDLTWEFKLRKGVKFHNGEPFNAAAAKFSLERCKTDSHSQYKSSVPDYKEIIAVDEYTLRFVTKKPIPEIAIMLELVSMVPPKYFQEWDKKDWTHLNHNPIGTGAYKFVEWVKDDHIKMVANDDWYGGKVDFKEVIIRPIPEDATRVAGLISGEIDVIWGVSSRDIPRIEKNKNTYISRTPSRYVPYIMFDVYTKEGGRAPEMQPGIPAGAPNPFRLKKVREAIAHGINVDDIIKHVMEGGAYPASQIIPQFVHGYSPNIKRLKYDPELAKKLLAEAGFPNGFEANFDACNDCFVNDSLIAEAIGHQLTKIGVNLKVVAQPKAVLYPSVEGYKSPMFLLEQGTFSWERTMNAFFRKQEGDEGRNNRGRFYDPGIENRIVEASKEMDPEKSVKLKRAVSEDIYATAYIIPLFYIENVIGLNKRVIGKARLDDRILAFELKRAK